MNGLESYSVLLAALERSAVRFGLRREPQKDSCGSSARKMQFSLGWNRAGAQTPASISSSRLQDRNFTQRGPRKSIEDDFMGKRRNCGVNEHLCFCTDANDTQQVTTRCIIAPFILKVFGRSAFRERHTPSLQALARLPADGTRSSEAPSPDCLSVFRADKKAFQHSGTGTKTVHTLSPIQL